MRSRGNVVVLSLQPSDHVVLISDENHVSGTPTHNLVVSSFCSTKRFAVFFAENRNIKVFFV